MTSTTEQDANADTETDGPDLLGDAMRAEYERAAKSLAEIQPGQQKFTEDQIAILRQLGIEDASEGDLNLFFHYCRTTGLDPFRRQIYMIGRNTKITEWVDDERAENGRRRVDKWVTKFTIQTGIDGYRKNGREAAKRYGDTLSFKGPWFTGEKDFHLNEETGEVIQHWRKVWPKGIPPHAARFIVVRDGEEFEAIVHYDEFVQTGYQNQPNAMWAKMPRNQIAKCAEAFAWRRAYPDDFAGLILEDSAQPTVIDQDGNVERRGGRGGRGASQPVTVDDIFEPAPEPQDAEVVEVEPDGHNTPEPEPGQDVGNDQSQGAETSSGAENVGTDSGDQAPPAPEPEAPPTPPKKAPAKKVAAKAVDADDQKPPKSTARKAKERRLFGLIGLIKPPLPDEDRYILYQQILERPDITSTDDLDDAAVDAVADTLYAWQQEGKLNDQVRDALNSHDLAAASAEEGAAEASPEGDPK